MKPRFSILLRILILLALSACGITTPSPTATTDPSRLPDPSDVKAFLTQLVDEKKVALGIVVGMSPQTRRNAGWSVMAG